MKKLILITVLCLFTLQCEQGWIKDVIIPKVEGCMDSNSCNYNSEAEEDDGNCIAKQGCNEWCEGDTTIVLELDCYGECGGIAEIDNCNVCSGGTSSLIPCTQDCADVWGGTSWMSDCGCVSADNSGNDCDDCAGTPNGTVVEDHCGVCGGDGTSCYGCTNPIACNYDATATIFDDSCWSAIDGCACSDGEGAVKDNCGTCGTDASNDCVQDCNGEWGGDAVLSGCDNLCNSTKIKDCAGVCGGTHVDSDCGTVTDIDGNVYKTIIIGTQTWMAENLKTTKYIDGSDIPTGHNNSDWINLSTRTGAYAIYDNDPANADIYGHLYNWYTVDDSRGVCPEGWHVPSDDEYTIFTDYLGGESVAGGKVKECTQGSCPESEFWTSPNTGATNESGFTVLPAGYRRANDGNYSALGKNGYFWSSFGNGSLYAWYLTLLNYNSNMIRHYLNREDGLSIRCLKSAP